MKRVALGRGLDALIPNVETPMEDARHKEIFEIEIQRIRPNPYQPRKNFDDVKIKELAESIRQKGMIQPIVIRRAGEDYELLVGERRYRAAQQLQLERIPAIVYDDISKQETMELALIENIQRENLNPIEEAEAFRILVNECGLTQNDLADKVGKDRSSVANTMRLLSLPEKIRQMIGEGKLSEGAARVILAIPGEKEKLEIADRVIRDALSVREVERLVYGEPKKRRISKKQIISSELFAVEEALKKKLRTKVSISPRNRGGRITIEYYDNDSLSRILDELRVFDIS